MSGVWDSLRLLVIHRWLETIDLGFAWTQRHMEVWPQEHYPWFEAFLHLQKAKYERWQLRFKFMRENGHLSYNYRKDSIWFVFFWQYSIAFGSVIVVSRLLFKSLWLLLIHYSSWSWWLLFQYFSDNCCGHDIFYW